MKIKSLKGTPKEPISHDPNILKQVWIRRDEIPNVTQFSKVVFKPEQVVSSHVHRDMYEVFLTTQGKGIIEIDEKAIPISSGVLITVEPGEYHKVINNSKDDLNIIVLGILDK